MKHPLGYCKYLFLALALLVLLPVAAQAQKQKKDNFGKEFYVAFAENHGSGDESKNFFALFITSRIATVGSIEVKALGWDTTFTTTPGKVTTIELPDGTYIDNFGNKQAGGQTVECTTSEQVLQGMAVHITSVDDIAVYGMNHKEFSSDAFMALPVGVLGTEYRTLNYQSSITGQGGNTPGEFWIVAVFDTTKITITPKARTAAGRPGGSQIKATLNKGDVFLVKGDQTDATNDLTGSLIESDQPIAVLSGHVRTETPAGYRNVGSGGSTSRDHLVEQLPPVSAWGDSALVVRYQSASLPDLVRIVSSEDDNVLSVNGVVKKTLQAGEFYEITSLTNPVSIQATSPILVGQYLHTSKYGTFGQDPAYGDPGYALVFPVEQFDTSYTFMLDQDPVFTGNFVNIIADPAGVATMMLDGALITGKPHKVQFQPIPGSNYVYAQVSFDASEQGTHNIYSEKPFGITVYAMGEVDSYAYPGGSLLKTITPFKTVDLVIDFGDRVMSGPLPYTFANNFWDTTVYLQNISSDPYTINGFATRTGDEPNFVVTAPVTPPSRTIGPGVKDSITIRFQTADPNVRKHTKINAVTEHLRAYVVDVFGRGILENAQIYSDSNSTKHIDTLDFGIFDALTDKQKDSAIYIANKGDKDVLINSDGITGPNAARFSIIAPETIKGKIIPTPPYTLHPYNKVLALQDSNAKVTLEFDPQGLPNGFYQAEYDMVAQGAAKKVILLAQIKTILKSTVQNAVFDTAFLCLDESRSIFVDNPNDFPITVTSVDLGGVNVAEFNLLTSIPLTVPPNSRGEIKLSFAPNDTTGIRTATATLSFDLPKNYTQTMQLTGFGDQLSSSFSSRTDTHILPGEETLLPIYAKSPMERLQSPSFILTVTYDSTYIENYDYVQENTLTALGQYTVDLTVPGYRQYFYQTLDNSLITGGGDTTQMPLVYLKFKSTLNGEDKLSFHKEIPISYKVVFDHSPFPDGCVLQTRPPALLTLDSSCETVHLRQDSFLYPPESYIEPVRPNPVTGDYAKFTFDIPSLSTQHSAASTPGSQTPVSLDLVDEKGNTVAAIINETRKPGTYELLWRNANALKPGMYFVRLQTAGQTKLRKFVVQR